MARAHDAMSSHIIPALFSLWCAMEYVIFSPLGSAVDLVSNVPASDYDNVAA